MDSSTPRVVKADTWSTSKHCLVHDLADLLSEGLGEGATVYCEILSEGIDNSAVYETVTCHDTIAVDFLLLHAEVVASVGHESVVLHEGACVEEEIDSLSGCELVGSVLFVDPLLTTAQHGLLVDLAPFLDEACEVRLWRGENR